MTWPKQNPNGGRAYEQTNYTAVSNVNLPLAIAAGAQLDVLIPWGVDGYTRGLMAMTFTPILGGGSFQIQAQPYGSDGQPLPGSLFQPVTPLLGMGGAGTETCHVSWFDNTEPGNWMLEQGGAPPVINSGGNAMNPTFATNSAYIKFRIDNQTSAIMTLTAWQFLLSGD